MRRKKKWVSIWFVLLLCVGWLLACQMAGGPQPKQTQSKAEIGVTKRPLVSSFGGSGEDVGHTLARDSQGNLYMAGYFHGTVSFGSTTLISAGYEDVFVVKMDANENVLWAKRAGGTQVDRANGVAVDSSGNVYVSGSFFSAPASFGSQSASSTNQSGDAFVAKLDSNGSWQWVQTVTGSEENWGIRVALDQQGRPCFTGKFRGTATFGTWGVEESNGADDIFVAGLNQDGTWRWVKMVGGSQNDMGWSVAIDASDQIYILGGYESGQIEFEKNSGDKIIILNAGAKDIFVAKLDQNGGWQWATRAGGSANEHPGGLALDSSGEPHIIGSFDGEMTFPSLEPLDPAGGMDVYVAKLHANGAWQWAKQAGGAGQDFGRSLVVSNTGKIHITGEFSSTATFGNLTPGLVSQGDRDVFVAVLDPNGSFLRAKGGGGAEQEHASQIVVNEVGTSFVTGYYKGTARFDDTQFSSQGGSDVLLWNTTPTPQCTVHVMKNGDRFGAPYRGFIPEGHLREITTGGWTGESAYANGYLYLMKNNVLYGAPYNGFLGSPLQVIASGADWTGKLTVSNGYLYLIKNDHLYGTSISGTMLGGSLQLITTGGWTGDIAASNGYLYLMKNNTLYGAAYNGASGNPLQVVASGPQWLGSFDVSEGYLYLMDNDALFGARIQGTTLKTGLQQLSSGGWSGEMAANCKEEPSHPRVYVYLMHNDNLYGVPYNALTQESKVSSITTGGWSGDLRASKGYVYLLKNNVLYGAKYNGLLPTSALQQIASGPEWTGKIAISNNYLYLMKNDGLYCVSIDGLSLGGTLQHITTGGWSGEIAASDGRLYLMKNNVLYGANYNGSSGHPLQVIASGSEWTGRMDISQGHLYLTKNGNFYGVPINGLSLGGGLQLISTGWMATFAVSK